MCNNGEKSVFSETGAKENSTNHASGRRGPRTTCEYKLVHSEFGITPAIGVCGREARPHVHPQRFARGKEEEYRGKKHIDPHYISLSDDAKRQEGRYGKRRVQGVTGAGKDTVSSILAPRESFTTTERRCVKPLNRNTCTSVQIAEARALNIAENPSYREAAQKVLRHAGNSSIVREEERLARRIASVEYAKGSHERCANLKEKKNAMDLGKPGEAIQVHVPFALDDSAPRPDNLTEHRGAHYRNAESKPTPENPPRRSNGAGEHRGLRDNVLLSKNDYPDPPAVGVRVMPRVAVRPSSSQHESKDCFDEDMLRRSRARCHQSANQKMPDFIFGQPPPPKAPQKTLRGITEERWRAEEKRAAERHTGRAMTHQSHKPTALW
ncbi:hypothetical protein C3747_14g189 [Trypanosoma cruzi]|uniref:Uncharacterized protein n=2 Tax=Trypanosoma cruzi TaxID=5693 RepID=Q4DXK5_TRYCC|nr:hypothetical protein, conserved [Trypanosoma cruzi]EAN97263.1 hypothetical protein, conserved [Trypanosoma cruzi]PWV18326.1 hypothetical protein C3747_14g189 [Trypanosoma cruzi]RNC45987.1 hypothetical protein TcCL_NonESM04213 [Trypanosoma cruzi]|eukprot:XP_819114.1 hypothetical protein [Trypanosoma cruzi strain CL Brener]